MGQKKIQGEHSLKEISEKDLAGWQITTGYFLELTHGGMGFFPAIHSDSKEPIICLEQNLIQQIRDTLPQKNCKIGKIILLVNINLKYGFDISKKLNPDVLNNELQKTTSLRILTLEDFNLITQDEVNPFEWAPGLIQLSG